MRIFVVSDMEGVSGVVKWEQVDGGEPLYEEARKLYKEEINAAVRGARAGKPLRQKSRIGIYRIPPALELVGTPVVLSTAPSPAPAAVRTPEP